MRQLHPKPLPASGEGQKEVLVLDSIDIDKCIYMISIQIFPSNYKSLILNS